MRAKTAPPTFGAGHGILASHRDKFPGVPGQVQGWLLRQVTFTKLYCRAVSIQA